jgi:hypothetical protein
MAVLNRCAIAVAPRSPMREWSRAFWGPEDHRDDSDEPSLYLIPTYDDDAEALTLLGELYDGIFSSELTLWCDDRELWPAPRSFDLFLQWFSLRLFPLVDDLGSEPLTVFAVPDRFRSSLGDALA